MDRNQVTGLVIIFGILLSYFMFFAPEPAELKNKQVVADTLRTNKPVQNTVGQPNTVVDTAALDLQAKQKFGDFAVGARGEAQEVVLENADIKVTLSTWGGKVKSVLLKNYLTYDKKPLYLLTDSNSTIKWELPVDGRTIDLSSLYYQVNNQADNKQVVFRLELAPNRYVEHVYKLPETGFQLDYDLSSQGIAITQPLAFTWVDKLRRLEADIAQARTTSTINYFTSEEDFDHLSESSLKEEKETFQAPLKWVSFKQKFFTAAIIAGEKNAFTGGNISSFTNEQDTTDIKTLQTNLNIAAADLKDGSAHFSYYFGPNKFNVLKSVTDGFEQNIYLGWPVISWVNKYLVINVFHFLEKFITNYGIIILLLVIIIKLILFPLSYKSYMSMAKMRVLKPEIDAIKEKADGDMTKIQQEQMKLYQQVGINPLSGCIPLLLQMPILLAMFNFFPNSIELRQESFMWAHDLSTYDSIFALPFSLPGYGSHVSLFTILMTASTIVLTWYNSQTSTVTGPMQSMQYIMPLVFMVILNSLPAGLSFYYLASNVVTIVQQMAIRKYVDDDKIRAKLEANKVKLAGKKKSSFMMRLEEAMKNAEEAKKKNK